MAGPETAESVATVDDIERTPQGVVKRWISEIEIASNAEKEWRKIADETIKVYKSEKTSECSFNILWSNTETLRPALYNSRPEPDVRRRFRDEDPVGKYGSLALKRSLAYSIDEYDFDYAVQNTVLDIVLAGRGVSRVEYQPTLQAIGEPDPLGNEPQQESIAYESAPCKHVVWNKFRRGPGETWDQVLWIAFEHRMPKQQLIEMFGADLAEEVPMDASEGSDRQQDKTLRSLTKTACIWEIWDKTKKKVLFISMGYPHKPLKEVDDPLRLSEFFPVPRPVYAIEDSTSLIPQTLYEKYKTQAEELNKVSRRIDKIVAALKTRGAYASNLSEIQTIIEAGDNQMIPIVNASEVAAMGGLDKAIWIMPIDKLAGVLQQLYEARAATLQTIYEITGLGDIMRGVSNPHETLGAQQLKSQWGTLRLQRLQREVQRFIRDLMRIKGEIIAEHFQPETLQLMTQIKLPTEEDKAQLQQQMQMAQQQAQATGQQPPEDMVAEAQKVLATPTWDDVMGLLRSDQIRRFHIGIETDSTIKETLSRDTQAMREAIGGIVEMFNGLGPAIQQGVMSVDVAKTLALSVARNAKMGDAVEDALEQLKQPPPPPPPPEDKSVEVANIKAQTDKELEQVRTQADFAKQQAGAQHEAQLAQVQAQLEQAKMESDSHAKTLEAQMKAEITLAQDRAKAEVALAAEQASAQIEQIKLASEERIAAADRDADAAKARMVETMKADSKRESDILKAAVQLITAQMSAQTAAAKTEADKETAGKEAEAKTAESDAKAAETETKSADVGAVLETLKQIMEASMKPKRFDFDMDDAGNVVGATSKMMGE